MDVKLTNLQQLRDAIMSIWTKISEECLQHPVDSMPQRIKAVLKAKGGPTLYKQGVPNKVACVCVCVHACVRASVRACVRVYKERDFYLSLI